MKISVVTVCYNSESTISRTIESVLNQTYTNIEYIIIDGKSTDGTVEIAKKYINDFSKKKIEYKIVSESDNGIYDAMNKGVHMATGDVVGIINSDDWYETNALQVVADTFKSENCDMFFADLRLIKENGSTIIKKSKHDHIVTSRHWNHPTTFIARRIYDKMQFKCTGIHDDFDLYLRIRKAGYKITIVNEVLANFTLDGATSHLKGFKISVGRIKERYKVYRSNGYSRLYILECLAIETAKFILN